LQYQPQAAFGPNIVEAAIGHGSVSITVVGAVEELRPDLVDGITFYSCRDGDKEGCRAEADSIEVHGGGSWDWI
jgi:hypothetical protein